jgi:uncharacterized repeat protein (TIGR03803 family)
VFKLDPAGNEAVLHTFTGGADGGNPSGLVRDAAGNLYGTAFGGGVVGRSCRFSECGVVFKLNSSGNETVLYSFAGGKDGANPVPGLAFDEVGNLYGATIDGGGDSFGVVFALSPTGNETVLHSFIGTDGGRPQAGPVRDAAGNLYGTTNNGGAFGYGVVYEVDRAHTETVLHNFGGADGKYPLAGLVRDATQAISTARPTEVAPTATGQCFWWVQMARKECCTALPETTVTPQTYFCSRTAPGFMEPQAWVAREPE